MMSISARVRSPNRTRSRRKFVLIKRKKIAPEQRKTVLAGQKKNVVLVEKRTCEPPMHAGRTIGAAGTAVRTGITGSLRGIDEIESDIVSLVRNTVSNTLRATGAVGTEAVSVASPAADKEPSSDQDRQ